MEEEVDESVTEFKKVASYIQHLRKNLPQEPILRYCDSAEAMVPPPLKKLVNPHY